MVEWTFRITVTKKMEICFNQGGLHPVYFYSCWYLIVFFLNLHMKQVFFSLMTGFILEYTPNSHCAFQCTISTLDCGKEWMYINWLIILLVQADPHVSIQKLTEKFVTDLQEDYPATVSTIFRTGDKLSMGSSITETSECCALCQVCGMYSTNIHMEISREAYKYYTNTKWTRTLQTLGVYICVDACICYCISSQVL